METLLNDRGPFVLMSLAKVPDWHGAFNEEDAKTDFDRACEVDDNVGVITARENTVLVFGGFPHTIGKVDVSHGEVLVFRIVYMCDVSKIGTQSFTELPDNVWHDSGVKVELEGDYLLYPATCNQESLVMGEPVLTLHFAKGCYKCQEYVLNPDAETRLILHRFRHA